MASKATTYSLLLLAVVAVASAGSGETGTSSTTTSSPTAYEMLEQYDFPRGILPEGVEGYELRPDGTFEIYFPRACEFLLARKWLVRYDARVSGAAAAGTLTALEGISVKVLFLWLPVGEVDRAGDRISLSIGLISTSFPLADFAESPRCRGFDGAGASYHDDELQLLELGNQ